MKSVEVCCSGVTKEDIDSLKPARLRDDAGVLTFELENEKAGDEAARLIINKGGALKSLIPVRESLEEVFSRLQVVSSDGAAPERKEEAK